MDSQDRADLFHAYQNYLAAFNANDIDAINDCVSFPLAYIGAGAVTMLDNFPVTPSELKAKTGWAKSEAFEIDIVSVGEDKAHLLMRNTRRLRADDSLIEQASAFYAYKKTAAGWKMFALSDIVFPAG